MAANELCKTDMQNCDECRSLFVAHRLFLALPAARLLSDEDAVGLQQAANLRGSAKPPFGPTVLQTRPPITVGTA